MWRCRGILDVLYLGSGINTEVPEAHVCSLEPTPSPSRSCSPSELHMWDIPGNKIIEEFLFYVPSYYKIECTLGSANTFWWSSSKSVRVSDHRTKSANSWNYLFPKITSRTYACEIWHEWSNWSTIWLKFPYRPFFTEDTRVPKTGWMGSRKDTHRSACWNLAWHTGERSGITKMK